MSVLPTHLDYVPRRDSSATESSFSESETCSISTTTSLPDDADSYPRASGSVSIVGLGCRLPGANNPSELWDNIVHQKDLRRKIPEDRFNVDAFYDPNSANKGTVSKSSMVPDLSR